MSITLKEFDYKKDHLRYDPDRKKYIGYQIDVRAAGKRHRDTFRTKAEAEQFVAELRTKKVYGKAGLRFDSRSDVLLRTMFDRRKSFIHGKKQKILADRVFRVFESLFPAPPKIRTIETADFQLYINQRATEGVTADTIDREITVLSAAFKQATAMFPKELAGYEPPRIARPVVSRKKRPQREITESECDAIVNAIRNDRLPGEHPQRTSSRPVIAEMFRLGWLLGLRFGEVEKLEKKDLRGNELHVTRWKTGDISVFGPLPTWIVDMLRENGERSPTTRVFTLECSRNTFDRTIQQACETVGIPYGRGIRGAVTFHSTRHAFTSRLVRVTDIGTARAFTGHSSKKMVEYYSHANEKEKTSAMNKLYKVDTEKDLAEIFEKVRSGKLSKKQFIDALK